MLLIATSETKSFLDSISVLADIAGIMSFFISVGTLITAVGIRKAVVKNVEKMNYRNEIDDKIKVLQSYYGSFHYDSDMYNEPLLSELQDILENLLISYESILKREIIKQIKDLKDYIEYKCLKDLNDAKAKSDCCHMLNRICSRLIKEKNLL